MPSIIPLTHDNFTPLTRTPWAGKHIVKNFKKKLSSSFSSELIGESWEFSCVKPFLSKCVEQNLYLKEYILSHHEECLGLGSEVELLVKLISTSDPLSIQLHPHDSYSKLKRDECGKPESWYILDHEPGAGVYVGFTKQATQLQITTALKSQNKSEIVKLMNFVEVKKGDYFVIEPGTVHAIGAGVCILEMQRVLPNKSGVTYRVWDWNRLYNSKGEIDLQNGQARELHLEQALDILDIESQSGTSFIKSIQPKPEVLLDGKHLCFDKNNYGQLNILQAQSMDQFEINFSNSYLVLLPLNENIEINLDSDPYSLELGRCYFVPAITSNFDVLCKKKSQLAIIKPSLTTLSITLN